MDEGLLPTPRWLWEKTDPDRSGAAGDLAKLFRNDPVKEPGVLAEKPPPRDATVLAREVIQNAWDAAIERQEKYERDIRSSETDYDDPGPPEFEILFRYRSAVGEEKRQLFSHLGLSTLRRRAEEVGDRTALGLSSHLCFDDLNSATPLTYLLIDETGTTGMYGPWAGAKSKLYLALLAIGFTPKVKGEGGSFGYGKAGLIAGSRVRTVVAYTCFRERLNDPGVSRRALGMTYWGQHALRGADFTGFARLGKPNEVSAQPFENEEADKVATLLGLKTRAPDRPEQWGTSLLLVEPTVSPDNLQKAICRSWWPALEEGRFHVEIETAYGEVLIPRPRSNPALAPFLDAYEIATQPQGVAEGRRRRYPLRAGQGRPRPGESGDGTLGLVADPQGWSFPPISPGDAGKNHRSLVALMRKPRMVVEYLEVGRSAPFVRGAFIAGASVNEQLRQTEPKGHDAWQTKPDGFGSPDAFATADSIQRRIRSLVGKYRKDLKPPPKPAERYQLKLFDRVMRRLLGGSAPSGPPQQKRPVTIHIDWRRLGEQAGVQYVKGKAEVGLSEHFDGESARVAVQIRFPLLEDGVARSNSLQVRVDPPPGFEARNGSYFGEVHRGEAAAFRFETEPYRADWTGRLEVRAEPIALPRAESSTSAGPSQS